MSLPLTKLDIERGIKAGYFIYGEKGEVLPTSYGKACARIAQLHESMNAAMNAGHKPTWQDLSKYQEIMLDTWQHLIATVGEGYGPPHKTD